MYLHDTAQVVVESLFVSEDSPGGYTIPPWFWALGDAPLPEEPHDSALGMNDTLAPLAALVKRALEISYGEAVSQSEAARILGVTPAAINRRIERGTLSSRKVGYHVLIPVKEIERARKAKEKREAEKL
jgi:excisionase family DNA binding protein